MINMHIVYTKEPIVTVCTVCPYVREQLTASFERGWGKGRMSTRLFVAKIKILNEISKQFFFEDKLNVPL